MLESIGLEFKPVGTLWYSAGHEYATPNPIEILSKGSIKYSPKSSYDPLWSALFEISSLYKVWF